MSGERALCAVVDVCDSAGRVVAAVVVAGDVPDLFVVDVAARVELAARAMGGTAHVREPRAVAELRDLCGLRRPLARPG